MLFAAYTIGFNVIFGSTGQLFLCVGALAGIGGFGATILADNVGLPIVVSILVATLAATLIGGLLSYVAVRRSLGVIFTGIVTLIFSMSFDALLLGLSSALRVLVVVHCLREAGSVIRLISARRATRAESVAQSAEFHEPTSPEPHSRRTTSATRSGTDRGSAPSELPQR